MKVILTSKNDVKRMAVEAFLEKYKIPYDELVCVEVDNPLL
jgi:non-canonical (house-cleaning) NTP pyrophosphatase